MTEVQYCTEKCPTCDVKIEWNERDTNNPTKGTCPHCGREFIPKKIRFL